MTNLQQIAEQAAKECGFDILPMGEGFHAGYSVVMAPIVKVRGESCEDAAKELGLTLKQGLSRLGAGCLIQWRSYPEVYPPSENQSEPDSHWYAHCRVMIFQPSTK